MTQKWRILAVDDEKDTLELLYIILKDEYEIIVIDNPMEAIRHLPAFEPDLILLDIMMPRLSGYQFCQILKRNPKFKDIPIMFLSAKDNMADKKHGYVVGAVSFITKPFTPELLLKNIDSFFHYSPPPQKRKKLAYSDIRKKYQLALIKEKLSHKKPNIIIEEDDTDWLD